jgi:hypothetical protein
METFMMRIRYRFVALLATTLLTSGPGCGTGPKAPPVDSSLTEAKVSGTVSVKGKPASGGEISFNPSNNLRIVPTRTAQIGEDGTYSITTLTGLNEVSFGGAVATKNVGVGLVKKYIDVKQSDNKQDFDLLTDGSQSP